MYRLILITLFSLLTGQAFSQTSDTTKHWKTGGALISNLAQVALQHWSAGGENSISLNSSLNLFANYKKGKVSWDNMLDLGYGILKQGNRRMIKSDDRIEVSTKYGRKAFNNWNYSLLAGFRTQFSAGYTSPDDTVKISDFLSPGFGLLALGLDYKPNETFTLLIAPLSGKFTIVKDQALADQGAFGVDPAVLDEAGNIVQQGDNLRKELGGYVKLLYKQPIMENITLQLKADLFSNYLNKPENIDINAEGLLTMKVNKFISASLLANLIYDHDTKIAIDDNGDDVVDREAPRTQIKEVLGIGFSYKF